MKKWGKVTEQERESIRKRKALNMSHELENDCRECCRNEIENLKNVISWIEKRGREGSLDLDESVYKAISSVIL